jgi:hypothetical protein
MTPEKIVEKEVTQWLKLHGWPYSIVDSRATFNSRAGRFLKNPTAPEGFSDIVGCTPSGIAIFLELKAKGRKSVRAKQRVFLMERVLAGAIAGVVRSVDELVSLASMTMEQRIEWLESFKVDYPR